MSTTTVDIRIILGATTYHLDEVGDPNDAMFALQIGRTVAETLISHKEEP